MARPKGARLSPGETLDGHKHEPRKGSWYRCRWCNKPLRWSPTFWVWVLAKP